MDILELLLSKEITKLPEKVIKHKRLTMECGQDVTFKLRALPYEKSSEIMKLHQEDAEVYIVLDGVIEPNLRNDELMKKYGVITPAELIKKLFLHGEIVDISREIERLSGFRINTIETINEIKKN